MYEVFQLDNGLSVIYHPTPGKDQVFVNLAYQVGSLNELPNQKGMAHFFEHMMFTGSQNIAHHHQEIQKIGGSCNAFTFFDTTRYFTSAAKEYLETIFWIESDRMFFPRMTKEKVCIQQKVIGEEMKQVLLTAPYGDLLLHLLPLVYKRNTPFSWPIIGEKEEDIMSIKLEALQQFGACFYSADNAVLAVSGDLAPGRVKELAQKWFSEKGVKPQKKMLPLLQPRGNDFSGIKTIKKEVPNAMLVQAYPIPRRADPTCLTLQLLVDFFDRGEEGFLHKELVKKLRWVKKLQVLPLNTLYGGLLLFLYYLADPRKADLVAEKAEELLNHIADRGIQEKLLKSLKNRIEKEWVATKSTPAQFNQHLVYAHFLGAPNFFDKEKENHLWSIDRAEIKETIVRFLRKENRTSLLYLPS